jgi:hypothetical protein
VEHTFSPPQIPWRTATLVASAIAAIELVVLVGVGVALLAEPVSRQVTKAAEEKALAPVVKKKPKPAAKPSPATPVLTRAETSVLVLNGNGTPGAAAATAERARAKGYAIAGVGNASGKHRRTVVMYRGGHEAEGRRLAKDMKVKIVGPLNGITKRDLMGAHVAVILGG